MSQKDILHHHGWKFCRIIDTHLMSEDDDPYLEVESLNDEDLFELGEVCCACHALEADCLVTFCHDGYEYDDECADGYSSLRRYYDLYWLMSLTET